MKVCTTRQVIEQFYDQFFQAIPSMGAAESFLPQLSLGEDDKSYQLKMSLPFLKENELDVRIKNGRLYISGSSQSRESKKDEQGSIQQIFSAAKNFSHSVNLPVDADEKKAAAEFKDHQLTVTIPKQNEQDQNSGRIPINARKSANQPSK